MKEIPVPAAVPVIIPHPAGLGGDPGPCPPRPAVSPLEKAERIPRSLVESPCFRPDWRWAQATVYLIEVNIRGGDALPSPPSWENDRPTLDYFRFLATRDVGNADKEAVLRWVHGARDIFVGAQIKAMLLAGRSVGTIAEGFGVPPLHIETFRLLFFDIAAHRDNPHFMANLVRTPGESRGGRNPNLERAERILLSVALHGSSELLEGFLLGFLPMNEAVERECVGLILGNLTARGLEAHLGEKALRPPDMSDLANVMKLKGQRSRAARKATAADNTPGLGLHDFLAAFWRKPAKRAQPVGEA